MSNRSQVILVRTDINLCRKELTVHWSQPISLIRSYRQLCTNSMWGDESEGVNLIIWLYQTVDAQKEEVVSPNLLITLRRHGSYRSYQPNNKFDEFATTSQFYIHLQINLIIERRCDMVCKCVFSYKFAVEPDIGWCWQYLQCSNECQFALTLTAGATFQYKDRLSQIWDSHGKDKTVARPSIINMGILIPVRRHIYIETAPDWEPYDIVKRYVNNASITAVTVAEH